MSGFGMTEEHRKILRKNFIKITQDLQADQIVPRMRELLTDTDVEEINACGTERKRAEKLVDTLPSKGENAYVTFVAAVTGVQQWLGKHLAVLGNIENQTGSDTQPSIGMEDAHRRVLSMFWLELVKTLDIERMVKSLLDSGTISETSAEHILANTTRKAKVADLVLDVLPKCGPDAFMAFYSCLQANQPQLASDFKTKAKEKYPDMVFESCDNIDESKKCQEDKKSNSEKYPLQETKNPAASPNDKTMANSASSEKSFTLSTPCSELPENVKAILYQTLDAEPDELFENDWKMLYKKLKLPRGKEEIIINKGGSPTERVIKSWTQRDGEDATLECLFCALNDCHHGELISRIKNTLGVAYNRKVLEEKQPEVVDGMMANMQLAPNRVVKVVPPLKLIKDIPANSRNGLIEQFDALPQSNTVLGEIATRILQKRCYVDNASRFMETIKEMKIRLLFRELKKEKKGDIVIWMRRNFPKGSTGPLKADDECRANQMSYLHRREITRELEVDGKWIAVAEFVGLKTSDVKHMEQRSKEPAEGVISYWEVRAATTVGALYELLVDSGYPSVADLL